MKKNAKKICTYQKNVVPLHSISGGYPKRHQKVTQLETQNLEIMNKIYKTASFARFEMNVTNINRNFRIKVYGMVNGVKVNKLVGVSGLLEILGGSVEKLVKMVLRALNAAADKCRCKLYGGAAVTFYSK